MFLLLSDFITYLYSEKGLAVASVEAYRRDLIFFLNFLEKKSVMDFQVFQEEDLLAYLNHLQKSGYASSSCARANFALKVFFRFLIKEKKISPHILLFLESPKVWQLIPEVLTIEEIERILNLIDSQTYFGSRDRAIVEVLYGCGLRVSELCSLNISDIDDHYLKIFGKGGKERLVPIGKKAVIAVDSYLNLRNEDNKALFLNNRGQRVDRTLVWRTVKHYAREAGITKCISPHTFRHTFATHLLDGGADIRFIQEMLGHATIASTQIYMHVNTNQLRESFFHYHPRK